MVSLILDPPWVIFLLTHPLLHNFTPELIINFNQYTLPSLRDTVVVRYFFVHGFLIYFCITILLLYAPLYFCKGIFGIFGIFFFVFSKQ